MKFVSVAVFLAFVLAVSVDSVTARILFTRHRYPIIYSGDIIALRLAYTSGSLSKNWFFCTNSYCGYTTCHGTVMQPSSWSSCSSYMIFKITAMGRKDGQPINSGDTVTLTNKAYGFTSAYHFRCETNANYKCRMTSTTSSMKGNNWLIYYWSTFQIYSRNAVDGTPVQYGDIVGFKYSYHAYNTWLYRSRGYFYSKGCSYYNKASCAAVNSHTGFQIFKQL